MINRLINQSTVCND